MELPPANGAVTLPRAERQVRMWRQVIQPTLGVVTLLSAGTAFAQSQPPVYYGHMWDGGWGMFLGPLWMIEIGRAHV